MSWDAVTTAFMPEEIRAGLWEPVIEDVPVAVHTCRMVSHIADVDVTCFGDPLAVTMPLFEVVPLPEPEVVVRPELTGWRPVAGYNPEPG